jgi:hypothetical protein
MENTEYKEPDTYGSYLRNRLSPFYNMIAAIYSCKSNPDGGISHEMLLNFLFNSVDDMWNDYKKILDISYDPLLDKSEYKND